MDLMWEGDRPLWGHWCIERIEFSWDQWMQCRITCLHGTYTAVSDGGRQAMEQSLERAAHEFRKDDDRHDFEL